MRLLEDVVDPRTLHRVPLSHWVRHALALLVELLDERSYRDRWPGDRQLKHLRGWTAGECENVELGILVGKVITTSIPELLLPVRRLSLSERSSAACVPEDDRADPAPATTLIPLDAKTLLSRGWPVKERCGSEALILSKVFSTPMDG